VVGAAAGAAEPPPDELFCANANVLDRANTVTKANVDGFIAVNLLLLMDDKPREEFKFRRHRRASASSQHRSPCEGSEVNAWIIDDGQER
jgi:hypothetical protein